MAQPRDVNILPPFVVERFPPLPNALLATAAGLVTDDMLEEISRADYGDDAERHLAALWKIRVEGRVAAPIGWHPKEVLELIRWSQPENLKWKPGSTGERGHIMRAFCCAALLRGAAEPKNAGYFDGENQTLIQLIQSALYLGRCLPEAAIGFLVWRIPSLTAVWPGTGCAPAGDEEDAPFFRFGLLALVLLIEPQALSPQQIGEMIDFIELAEAGGVRDEHSGKSFMANACFNQRLPAWRALAARLRSNFPGHPRLVEFTRRIETT